ncbi:hypothetical protein GCM10010873_36910 [Cypionkella aquatica]|uniref:Uncharacterized protein n=1 Tax=Cypionkella aquatica TaxID=1756042 RepID=A0AA37TW57_9RHOB|nr:hypothetical protein [Cypionkella aquatica]GLS88717.1 hypothetical protein GCM10010873_36910 [Cypionkella aquatica]
MPWTVVVDDRGQRWGVNQEGVYLMLRAALRAEKIRARSQITSVENGLLLPTTYLFETDWAGLRADVDQETNTFYLDAAARLARDPASMRANLLGMIGRGRTDFNAVEAMRRRATRQSSASISSNVEGWETALSVAQFVRDTSATILVVGAGLLSGGAAFGVLGAGSVLRGTATYQDTGNVGAAVINGSGTFIVGMVGIAGGNPALARSEQIQVMFVGSGLQGGVQGMQSLVEGKTPKQALQQAAVSAGFNLLGSAVGGRIENMSFSTRLVVGGVIDTTGNALTAATVPTPAPQAIARPAVTGNLDFAGIPFDPAADELYLAQNCLRRL